MSGRRSEDDRVRHGEGRLRDRPEREPSVNGQQNQLIATEDKYFQWLRTAVKAGVKARIFPEYFAPLLDRLMLNADALSTLDEMGIGTTAYHIVCEKPAI